MMRTSSLSVDTARQLAAAGRHAEVIAYLGARKGTDLALDQARRHAEPAVERHALNARGAIALVSGRIDEAADCFTRALMAASRDGDPATTARCSNNLGIISNLRGRHAEA